MLDELLDTYYNEYRAHKDWHYADFITHAQERNPLHALAILVSNYNGQVLNGGHLQYFDNGYADGRGGCFASHPTTEMHSLMLSLFVSLNLATDPRFKIVLPIMRMFRIDPESECENCGGNGVFTCTDDDGSEYEEDCYECSGRGFTPEPSINSDLADNLDDLYYAVYKRFMSDFESMLCEREAL